jgi:hypothetical protein
MFGPEDAQRRWAGVSLATPAVGALRAHRLAQDAKRQRCAGAYANHGLVFASEDGHRYRPIFLMTASEGLLEKLGVRRIRLHGLREGTISMWAATT